jgi:NTP pyrophosphatase (non-canonical NTP hydrolase)
MVKPFRELVAKELHSSVEKHGHLQSLHEAFAVILEEVDELWEHVRKKTKQRDPEEILEELVQIAAMAQKTAEDIVVPMMMKNDNV